MLMKKFFKNCAMFIALAAMSLSLNAQVAGDDLTSRFQDPTFAQDTTYWKATFGEWSGFPSGWTIGTSSNELGFQGTFLKATSSKKFGNYEVAQTVEGMPLGDYEVSATLYRDEDGNGSKGALYLYANSANAKAGNSTVTAGSEAGAKVTVKTRIADGKLTVKFAHDKNYRNKVVAFGDLKVIYMGAPELAPALATAETFATQKMLADYSTRYATAIAAAKAHAGNLDTEYINLCTEFETLNAVAQGSIDDFAAYAAAIAKAEAFVAASTIADKAAIETAIKTMPHYFADYDTTVEFISMETLETNHKGLPHGGNVIRTGKTGWNEECNQTMEFKLTLASNPQFTSSIMVACARAAVRMHSRGITGCQTIFDIAPSDLHILSRNELLASIL